MPLPIILEKLKSIGKQVGLAMLRQFSPVAGVLATVADNANESYNRLSATQKQQGFGNVILGIRNYALGSLAAFTGGAILAVGGYALAGLASLGTVGALTATMIGGGFLAISVTQIVSLIFGTTNFIINFNINKSDTELDAELVAKIESFYGLLGEAVGSAMGYLVCGALPGAVAFAFNPAVGAAIMRDLDDDIRSEILGSVNQISRSAFQTLINAALVEKFKSTRRTLKKNPDSGFSKIVRSIMGEENWKNWGKSNQESFTIYNNVIEKRIEAIPDKGKREFLENALEGFGDSCMEAGYIVANTLDSQLAAQALMRQAILGNPTDVRISFA
ncbi:hypothetical protein PI95_031760 [Hassallia byssoidea VB512170]|uniref:Uncharacterized protein n=1 Tax=Hassallia byssoidea VB512170 TaxID=1304833 RepID=A0A846HLY4_9CYAN|nr:hypothetical protein [Hassalia byssoidea]NEU76951.1 hypothetical protein [Hassalia byssoidea VB512170]